MSSEYSALRAWKVSGQHEKHARKAGRASLPARVRIPDLPLMDGETAEVQSPARTRMGPPGLGRETSAIRFWKLKPPRAAVALKANGRVTAGERDLRLPLARSSPS